MPAKQPVVREWRPVTKANGKVAPHSNRKKKLATAKTTIATDKSTKTCLVCVKPPAVKAKKLVTTGVGKTVPHPNLSPKFAIASTTIVTD